MDNNQKLLEIASMILMVPEEQVTDQTSSDTTDTWDSLNHIALIGALEQEFGVKLPTENFNEAQSISKLKTLLSEHGIQF